MEKLELIIKQSAIAKLKGKDKNILYNDIEDVKALEASNTEITGKTKHGLNFSKFLHSIIIF